VSLSFCQIFENLFHFSRTTISNVPLHSVFSSASNFVSFSSSVSSHPPSPPPPITPSQQIKPLTIDPKSMLYDSAETKSSRLQTFANLLKQSISSAQIRTGNDENDHAIEHIYQIGNQQRLFIDYRPDELTNQLNSYGTHATSFLTQTFRGKLYIDEVYICSGQGTNKKLCKRYCFQQALNRFLYENFDVKLFLNKDGREQYELITKISNENQEEFHLQDNQDKESFFIPSDHPMANTKMNFVHARDTSTIAQRVAREQNKLEQRYWQQWGRGMPISTKSRRIQRSLSPPPPVPHQTTNENITTVIEAGPTTSAYVSVCILLINISLK
jgi:hypothetical protein